MKRFQNILMAVAVSALAVVSCAKEEVAPESNVQEDKVYEYLFTLGEGDTKATLEEGNVVTWQTGDYLGVVCKYATSAGGYSYSYSNDKTKSSITPASGDTPAKFLVKSYNALTVGGKVFCFFPYIDKQFENPNITMSIPASQNNTINEMPMASIPFTVTSDVPAQTGTEVGDIKMLMLGSIARFKIYSSNTEWQGETIKSVKFETTSTDIAGSFNINIENIDLADASTLAITLSDKVSTSITESVSDMAVTGDKENGIVDMVIAPGTYSGTLTITTNAATYGFTLSDKEFQRAHIKPFAVDLASKNCTRTEFETAVYELVTSVSGIIPGEYLIAAEYGEAIHFVPNAAVAAKNLKNKDCTTLTLEGNDYKGDATGFNWTFEGTNSEMSIKSVADPTCYLYATNDNNGMVVGNKNAFWSISEATNGFYLKTTDGTNDRYLSQYNSQDWRCYKSSTVSNGTAVIKLYKLHDTTPAITGVNIEMTSAVGDVAESALTLHNFESAPAETDFTVVSKPDYVSDCEFSDITKDGATFACIVANNYSIENDREGEIEISVNGVSTTISVSQPKSVFEVLPVELQLGKAANSTAEFVIKSTFAGADAITIDNPDDFELSASSYSADEVEGTTITVTAKKAGLTEAERTATITVSRTGLESKTISVTQLQNIVHKLAAPQNISITKNTTSKIGASWTAPAESDNITSYKWIISTSEISEGITEGNTIATGNADGISFEKEGTFAAEVTYYVYVRSESTSLDFEPSDYARSDCFTVTAVTDKTASVTFSNLYSSNTPLNGVEVKIDDYVSITFDNGGGTSPQYYATGTAVRAYAKNNLTITASKGSITKVELTFASGGDSNTISVDSGNYSNNTWTGDASSVKFTIDGTSGHRRISAIKVYYSGSFPTVNVTGVTIDKNETEISVGGKETLTATVNPNDATNKKVTWSSDDPTTASVNATTGEVTGVKAGTATITVTTEDGGYTASCEVTVTTSVTPSETEYKDAETTFTSNTLTDGWTTNGTFNSSYYKMTEGQYAKATSTVLFKGQVLSTDMKINVACGTFGSWSGDKKITLKAEFYDSSDTVLSTVEYETSTLNSTQGTYRGEFTLSKPADPSKIAYMKIIFKTLKTGNEARFAKVKLNYSTTSK